jgi:hypothetical protein
VRTADSENRLTDFFFKFGKLRRFSEWENFFLKKRTKAVVRTCPPKNRNRRISHNSQNRPTLVYCWSQTLFPQKRVFSKKLVSILVPEPSSSSGSKNGSGFKHGSGSRRNETRLWFSFY